MAYFRAKNKCWDLIKKHYPIYEGKAPIIESLVRNYIKRDSVLLDVGCGRGKETAICYKNEVNLAIGIDLSDKIKFNETIHLPIVADACKLPLGDSSVDLVISQELIEHLEYPEKLFSEVSRILKANGVFVFATPNLLSWKSLISLVTPHSLHIKLNKQLHGVKAEDVFPTYYRMNRIRKIQKVMPKYNMKLDRLIMWEGTPKTLTFNSIATYIDIFITTLLRKKDSLKNYRELIVASYRKEAS